MFAPQFAPSSALSSMSATLEAPWDLMIPLHLAQLSTQKLHERSYRTEDQIRKAVLMRNLLMKAKTSAERILKNPPPRSSSFRRAVESPSPRHEYAPQQQQCAQFSQNQWPSAPPSSTMPPTCSTHSSYIYGTPSRDESVASDITPRDDTVLVEPLPLDDEDEELFWTSSKSEQDVVEDATNSAPTNSALFTSKNG
ncbi:hypothetical protein HK102_003788, partial [Quaeritorhiza haematococci]